MAKRKGARRGRAAAGSRKSTSARRAMKRTATKKAAKKGAATRKAVKAASRTRKTGAKAKRARLAAARPARGKSPRLNRARRTLDDTVPTPPSSLDMDRHGSAARTGREELAENRRNHQSMSPEITSGDIDVDVEDAYFTGEAAPGGDNPTPDQDIVDNIGKALGVEYEDNEELKASDKVTERDKHRWELDPASSEDYKDRK
jgi:Family of unknown function (DUF6335)